MIRIFGTSDYHHTADFIAIREMLRSYAKAGENRCWDIFRAKVPADILAMWGEILFACNENGFFGPYVRDSKICWRQATEKAAAK